MPGAPSSVLAPSSLFAEFCPPVVNVTDQDKQKKALAATQQPQCVFNCALL